MISLQGQTLFKLYGREKDCTRPGAKRPLTLAPVCLLQEGTHQLVENGRYDTREDFTVVVQPFFEKVDMPKTSVTKATFMGKGEPRSVQFVVSFLYPTSL